MDTTDVEPTTSDADQNLKLSYSLNNWKRLRNTCQVLSETELQVSGLKVEIEQKLRTTEFSRQFQSKSQSLCVQINILKKQLDWRHERIRVLQTKHARLNRHLIVFADKLKDFQLKIDEVFSKNEKELREYIFRRENLTRTNAQLRMRRKQMVAELNYIYPINEALTGHNKEKQTKEIVSTVPISDCNCTKIWSICDVHLPDAESYIGHEETRVSVGLGYVAHLIAVLSSVLNLHLRYHLHLLGSRSAIEDHILENLSTNDRTFPLYYNKHDRIRFEYGVFLLNKNIAQLRCYVGLATPDPRRTLFNLKHFLDILTNFRVDRSQPPNSLSASNSIRQFDVASSNISLTSEQHSPTASSGTFDYVARLAIFKHDDAENNLEDCSNAVSSGEHFGDTSTSLINGCVSENSDNLVV